MTKSMLSGWNFASTFFAMQGPIKQVSAPSYLFFTQMPQETMGEVVLEILSPNSGKCFFT